MKKSKIEGVRYNEPCESFTLCILDPSINGEEYVKDLNDSIEDYNKDVEIFEEKLQELKRLYMAYRSYEEITGSSVLNEREPKYPNKIPDGFKNHQTAFPEITAERERRRLINKKNREVYDAFMGEANENIKREIQPFKESLIAKWPKFKKWTTNDWGRKIYYSFSLEYFSYVS
jgi:hypothetical protein